MSPEFPTCSFKTVRARADRIQRDGRPGLGDAIPAANEGTGDGGFSLFARPQARRGAALPGSRSCALGSDRNVTLGNFLIDMVHEEGIVTRVSGSGSPIAMHRDWEPVTDEPGGMACQDRHLRSGWGPGRGSCLPSHGGEKFRVVGANDYSPVPVPSAVCTCVCGVPSEGSYRCAFTGRLGPQRRCASGDGRLGPKRVTSRLGILQKAFKRKGLPPAIDCRRGPKSGGCRDEEAALSPKWG
jgi:hypothetical protein